MQRKQSGFAVMDVTGERSGRVLAERGEKSARHWARV